MMDSDSKATTSLFDPNFIDTTPVKIQQFSSVAQLYPTLYNPMNGSTPGFPVHHHPQTLLKLMSIESVTPFSHLILCHSLFLLPSIFPSIRVFSKQSVLHIRWPKYWGFSFSISPFNEYSGLISFSIDYCQYLTSKRFSRVFPAPQFKGINSLALRLFYCPVLTSVHDYWKNHSFDYMDLCRQSNASAF